MIFPALQPACLIYNRSYKLCTAKSFEMAVFELQKARINSDMLSRYISRPICFVGRVEKIHPTGKSFSLSDGEGKSASVELNEPLDEELSGVVEVLGMVSNKGTIMASAYNILREDKGIPFDLELYNDVLKVIHDFPQHYPFEIATSG
ncbi:replication protein A 14 kDa subunit-like [Salvelinus alpinus]|uniref:Replication protein A 14 kDa subunit-like n=1 Tax=Salvelinus namaycush TaxID=8040 RepID=A0A8U0PQZ3_SALNM|nr:replication protein A 14 kDa subunit [Salvelinus alpinus]XP_038828184.1 replication protein A 14 kDa subunit-like [Salvelinus namaycush]XP_055749955.1 replication protein A 14 kDa subunit-like isoform X1 [Salvelinus fontinalis]